MEEECYFAWQFHCKESKQKEKLGNAKDKKIKKIIRCSKIYRDGIHQELELQYVENKDLCLRVHKTYADTYVHPKAVEKALKCQQDDNEEDTPPPKRTMQDCKVEKGPRHPSRWKPAYCVRQIDRSETKKSPKTED